MLIKKVKGASSRKELILVLEGQPEEIKHIMLTNAIESINKEIERDIKSGDLDVAIYKMSQVVMLEDEMHIIERKLFKQRALYI